MIAARRSHRYPVVIAAVLLLLWASAAYAAPRSRSMPAEWIDRPAAIDPNAAVVAGFSPGAGGYRAEDVVLQSIDEARSSIHMAAYSFSSKPVATALLAAKRRGIDVLIVVDYKENKRKYSAATFTANQGIPTRTDDHYAIMHNKFLVVDGSNVETGSFNYTAAARDKNAENALLLRNVPWLAAIYDKEWQRLWRESQPIAPRY